MIPPTSDGQVKFEAKLRVCLIKVKVEVLCCDPVQAAYMSLQRQILLLVGCALRAEEVLIQPGQDVPLSLVDDRVLHILADVWTNNNNSLNTHSL